MKHASRLFNTTVYLAGPIENTVDLGLGWRKNFAQQCCESHVGIKVLDPTRKPKGMVWEVRVEGEYLKMLKYKKAWDELTKYMKTIIRTDLKMLDYSQFVVARIDQSIHTCGTYGEITVASVQKKPILLIVEGGKEACPGWLFGLVHHDEIFSTVKECVDYLAKINNNAMQTDDRWLLCVNEGIKRLPRVTEPETD